MGSPKELLSSSWSWPHTSDHSYHRRKEWWWNHWTIWCDQQRPQHQNRPNISVFYQHNSHLDSMICCSSQRWSFRFHIWMRYWRWRSHRELGFWVSFRRKVCCQHFSVVGFLRELHQLVISQELSFRIVWFILSPQNSLRQGLVIR